MISSFKRSTGSPGPTGNFAGHAKSSIRRACLGLASAWVFGSLLIQTSEAQVTHLSTTTGSSTATAAITVAHTTSAASNRLMLVGISHTKDDATINSVTYGGVALTALGTAQTSDFRTRIYRLNAPASGTANVVVTFSANLQKGAIATVSTYSGVNQTVALGTLAAGSGDSTAPSVAVASVSGDLVHDVLTTETGSGTITLGAGQTLNGTAPADVEIVRNRSSRETAAGATTTMSYAMTAKKWSISGVAIKSAPPSPVISVSGTLVAVNTTFGSASSSPSSFTISGTNMTAGITVAPPAGFQVSTVSGSGYSTSIVVGASGSIAPTTVFVRLAASTNAGTFSGNVTLSSTGATSQTIATASSVVSRATPTITTAPTASSITFGQTLASSTLSSGVGSVAGSFAFTTPSTAPNAGAAAQGFTFTPTDSVNYNIATGTVNVTVAKANSTVTTAPTASSITFGETLASSTLSGGAASVAGVFAFTTPSTAPNAGIAAQEFTFTPTDSVNYNTATGTVNVTVAKASSEITTAPTASPITFGQTLASSTLSGGAGSVAGAFAFTTPSTAPDAGTASQGFTFTPTDSVNYNTATGTVNVTVAKANSTVTTAPTASSITFGQTLASSTLSGGSGSVAGSFAFTTPSTAPNAGTASQGFTFTPTDSLNYNTVTGSVSVVVLPKPPTFSGFAVTTKIDKLLPVFPVKILARASDSNGGTVSLSRVFPASAQGGSVTLTSTVNYTPPPGFTGADSFEVELTSSTGGVLRARIDVMVTVITTKFLSFTVIGGKPVVEFRGIPGRSYAIERSTDLSSWTVIGTVIAAADGIIRFTDDVPPAPSGYYRTQN